LVQPPTVYRCPSLCSKVIVASDGVCLCCNRARGYLYVGPVFTTHRDVRDNLCPWCISDGAAAQEYKAYFSYPGPLNAAMVSCEIDLPNFFGPCSTRKISARCWH
jgi:uncharacterized protein